MTPYLTRRKFLLSAAAVSTLPSHVLAAEPGVSVKDMLRLSSMLLRKPESVLFSSIAQRILDVYKNLGMTAQLQALSQDPSTNPALAAEIISAWYSGEMATKDGTVVVTYNNALLWQTADFLHPQGNCGGSMNYWTSAPTT
jgi:hypothetical protein